MTEIPVSDSFQPAPGAKYEDEQPGAAPAAPAEAPTPEAAQPTAGATPEPAKEPEKPKDEPKPPLGRPAKAKPIADLLNKKHELETQLEAERKARAELEAKLAAAAEKPSSPQATADIKALAEKHGLDEGILSDIVAAARAEQKPAELPKEVADLLAEREREKATQAEMKAFEARVDKLATTLNDEQLRDPKVRERLLKMAYSDEKAPDGEPYFQKELAELYFGFIKPEIEPGKPSADPSRGGASGGSQVLDFEDVYAKDDPKDIEAMDSATFAKYQTWIREHKETQSPIKRTVK